MRGPPTRHITDWTVLLILAGGTWLGLAAAGPPGPVPATAAADRFSAQRALNDLQFIARLPHPVGSARHDTVRDYLASRLRQLGCDSVEVQHATGFNTLGDTPIAAAVDNVICLKRGVHPGRAVVLMAHYDAVPRSYGAADDGAGVAAILETLRALQHSPPFANDLVAVFTDAEEEGLLGAEAFVDLHPWARQAAVVLNVDARGVSGPTYMFQTTPGNAPLIAALADVPDARANSLTGDIYRLLPSDTDLSIWLHAAWQGGGYNFAFVGGVTRYHTPRDNLASLSLASLQHVGDYLLPLARRLGNGDVSALRTRDVEYFSAPLIGLIDYPVSWALPIAVAEAAAVLVLLAAAVGRKALSWRGVGWGTLLSIGALLVPAALAWAGWRVTAALHPGYRDMLQGAPYHAGLYFAGFALLGAALVIGGVQLATRAATVLDLSVMPLLLWAAAGLSAATLLPGGSYLVAWPLGAALLGGAAVLLDWPPPVVALSALPALMLVVPLAAALDTAMSVAILPATVLLVAFTTLLVAVPVRQAASAWRFALPAVAAAGAIALVMAELIGFDATHPHPDSLLYVANADSGRAWWATWDRRPDGWTRRTLGAAPAKHSFVGFHLGFGVDSLPAVAAPVDTSARADVHIVSSVFLPGGRRLRLRITAPGETRWITLAFAGAPLTLSDVVLDGRPLEPGSGDKYRPLYHVGGAGQFLTFYGMPAGGIDLRFTVPVTDRFPVRVTATTAGLPQLRGAPGPRPLSFMSKPFVVTDEKVVSETVWM